ncbi:MAG: dihydroorotase [Sedimentisphaerales bacterium]|jgi:dihydroorotase
MAKSILIKNGLVIDPANKINQKANVYAVDGKIAEVSKYEPKADLVIDAEGKLVLPGLIDIHVHFREPGDEEEETIASGSAAAVAGGFTSVVCMPNTDPAIDDATSVEYIHRMGRQTRKTHVYVMGAITKARAGEQLAEMGFMAQAGAVGFTDDGSGVQNTAVMLRAMKYASMFKNIVISQHCQDNSLAGSGVMNAGYNSTVLGLPGIDPLAEEMMLWRDIQLVRKTNMRYHVQHVSTAKSVELIRQAKNDCLPITCEAAPHHLLLTDDACRDYDTNYKVNPPLRTEKDIEAIKQAIKDGVIDALASDHAPHLKSEKDLEFLAAPFGIASLECALGLYIKALIEPKIIDWPQLVSIMAERPAKIISVDKGTLGKGKQADITIIDPDFEYTVDVNKFRSKSKNCPYAGWKLKGKAKYTIVGGEIRYSARGN